MKLRRLKKLLAATAALAVAISSIGTGIFGAAPVAAADSALLPAFPGAEGGGMYATGGRGGKIYHVTNLNSSGTGSFRDAVSGSNRIVVFDVGGTIDLGGKDVVCKGNITIAGQTAPGGHGITLRNGKIGMGGDNIIVRFISSRPGEKGIESDYDAWGGSAGSKNYTISDEMDFNNDIIWSGKEWITPKYPPEVSSDGVSFEKLDGSEELKNSFKDNSVEYFWTGSNYLVYYSQNAHTYMAYLSSKYLYRISEDMKTIIDTYEIPDNRWINKIIAYNDTYYISTEKVVPKYLNGEGSRVYGEDVCDFEIFFCNDFTNWQILELPFELQKHEIRPSILTADGTNMLIVNYESGEGSLSGFGEFYRGLNCKNVGIISNNTVYSVNYEDICGKEFNVCGDYYYTELGDDGFSEQIAFSKDGIYWDKINLTGQSRLLKVYESNGDIIIKCFNDGNTTYNICNKSDLYAQLINAKYNHTYIRLNDKILGFAQPPVIESDRTLVPMRFLFEQMGAEVDWDDATQTATATISNTVAKGFVDSAAAVGLAEQGTAIDSKAKPLAANTAGDTNSVTFSIDDTNATVNGEAATMDVPARLINDQTFVPLRFLSENLGYDVQWDESTNTAIITTE